MSDDAERIRKLQAAIDEQMGQMEAQVADVKGKVIWMQERLGRAVQLLVELREWCGSEYHSNAKIDARVDEFLMEMKGKT